MFGKVNAQFYDLDNGATYLSAALKIGYHSSKLQRSIEETRIGFNANFEDDNLIYGVSTILALYRTTEN
ncbi:hypothetical protein ACTXT7_001925 [Hymenolepis weldensis]